MPHILPPQPRRHHTLGHVPQPAPLSPNQSRYLTPNQHKRIESWRSLTEASQQASSPPSSPPPSSSRNDHSPSTSQSQARSGDESSPGTCLICASRSVCSCTTCSPKTRVKGYYKRSKSRKMSGRVQDKDNAKITSHSSSAQLAPTLHLPNKNGMPTIEQIQEYHHGAPPPAQFGPPPTIPIPEAAVAVPPAQTHHLPRIAGARDPVTQNYFRQMFPPVGAPFAQPGLHPPMMFGMPNRGPWGF